MKKTLLIILIIAVLIFSSYQLFGFSSALFLEDISQDLPKAGAYPKRDLSKVNYLVIHHSATEDQGPNDYAAYHISKGWPGIGYHYVINRDGKIFLTNPLETVSYHVAGHNTESVGICLSGNLSVTPMTARQKRSLKSLLSKLKKIFPGAQVKGHRDFVNTSCPGTLTDILDFV